MTESTNKAAESLTLLHKVEVTEVSEFETTNRVTRKIENPYRDRSLHLRVFDLAAFGLATGMDVTEVEIGVEDAQGATGSQPLTVNLYVKTNPAAPLTFANLTSIGTAATSVSDQALTVLTSACPDIVGGHNG